MTQRREAALLHCASAPAAHQAENSQLLHRSSAVSPGGTFPLHSFFTGASTGEKGAQKGLGSTKALR
jgi:hypothetical protein